MNIIVTGASRGIGRELALHLARQGGHRIILIARDEEKLKKICEGDPYTLIPLPVDLENCDYDELGKKIRALMPEVNVLVNNAGSMIKKNFGNFTATDFDHIMHVNVRSAMMLSQELLPIFESGAHIVNISSMGGYQGSVKFPGLSLYSASKAALAVLSECMALELSSYDVSVNCLALGSARTEMLEEAFPGYEAPLKAEEMAAFIADFALMGQKYFNGKVLPVSLSTP